MPKRRVFVEYRRDPHDGTQLRNVLTPSGKTDVGTQSLVATPGGEHQAWLFKRPGEEEAHAKDNSQAVQTARKKARLEKERGKPARTSLAVRAEALGIGSGLNMGTPLGSGPDREKTQKALSAQVLRAEQSAQERDAQTAWQKAYKQVKASVSLPPPPKKKKTTKKHMCAEFPQPS